MTDQRAAAVKRKADAWKLLREGGQEHTRGAMYLGGYAIECKLKAIGMERFQCLTLTGLASRLGVDERDVYTHGLEALLKRLRLQDRLLKSPVAHEFSNQVRFWSPAWRYDRSNPRVDDAETFLRAVNNVFGWLDSNRY